MMSHKITNIEIETAADLLRTGHLIAFPTETVYGLGTDASNAKAIEKIFIAKGRLASKPIAILIEQSGQTRDWARAFPKTAQLLAKKFWPGPLTLVLSRIQGVSDILTAGQDTIGLRVPNHPVTQALLRVFGGAIATTSANYSGHVSPVKASQVQTELGNTVDLILEGECTLGIESTVVDVTGPHPKILRVGAISADAINAALKE